MNIVNKKVRRIVALLCLLSCFVFSMPSSALTEGPKVENDNTRDIVISALRGSNIQSEMISGLNMDIGALDEKANKTTQEIQDSERQIAETRSSIVRANDEIDKKSKEVDEKKEDLIDIIRSSYKNRDNGIIDILLESDSVSDIYSKIVYVNTINDSICKRVDDLNNTKRSLILSKKNLEMQNRQLSDIQQYLSQRKRVLEYDIATKKIILDETANSQENFRRMMELVLNEYLNMENDIASFKIPENIGSEIRDILSKNWDNNRKLTWPITGANRGSITASFHDDSYRRFFGVVHEATDIDANQNTPIVAPADGLVICVRDAGYGYSYMLVIHARNFITLYGHPTAFLVAPGSFVRRGQAIALSGGAPGSKGAGYMTTGPHLHFGVYENGIPVDPVNFLE